MTFSCTAPAENTPKKPTGLINKKTAIQYEKNYVDHQYKYINQYVNKNLGKNSTEKFKDHREVFFTLENLENYLAYVKKASKEKGYQGLGIRIYFGAKKGADSLYKSTVFLSPTHQSSVNKPSKNAIKNSFYTAKERPINSTDIDALNYGSSGEPDNYNGN
ncbi:MAG: hypothetical protein COB98_02925 [Flavobacteriaceae bacterium]|nr:MAG: hypothetical protein COB98_02925 [Flavobacteriaceae bacterium]